MSQIYREYRLLFQASTLAVSIALVTPLSALAEYGDAQSGHA